MPRDVSKRVVQFVSTLTTTAVALELLPAQTRKLTLIRIILEFSIRSSSGDSIMSWYVNHRPQDISLLNSLTAGSNLDHGFVPDEMLLVGSGVYSPIDKYQSLIIDSKGMRELEIGDVIDFIIDTSNSNTQTVAGTAVLFFKET